MSTKWYGSLDNRVEENRMFCDKIEVGTGMTEYLWSDRHPYEVIAVQDQKHVTVRRMKHKRIGKPYENKWELFSDENGAEINMVKRGNYWYASVTATADMLEDSNIDTRIWLVQNGFNPETIKKQGKQTKYHRMNVSFGRAEYYYDYEF